MNIKTAIKQAIIQLNSNSDSARTDAECLLAYILNKPRSFLYTWPEATLSQEQQDTLSDVLSRRSRGEPIAYIIGKKEFWSLELFTSPATLIPRTETELLVELALDQLPVGKSSLALDLGTGSGAIAIAIATERPLCQLLAADRSAAAMAIAQKNRKHHKISNLQFCLSNWFNGIAHDRQFDIVVSNPPYIAPNDPHLTQGDLRFEPIQALTTNKHGLSALYHIAEQAPGYLKPGAWLMMEHGFDQGRAITEKLSALGYTQIKDHNDYSGQPRIVCACWSN